MIIRVKVARQTILTLSLYSKRYTLPGLDVKWWFNELIHSDCTALSSDHFGIRAVTKGGFLYVATGRLKEADSVRLCLAMVWLCHPAEVSFVLDILFRMDNKLLME